MAESSPVTMRRSIFFLVGASALLFALFDVRFVFDISAGSEREITDPAVEAGYARCYEQKDEDIHETAFGTIDNPDVQREFITSRRAIARRECRARYPESTIIVEEPARFNLVDLEPRFW
jgi:hypothetical protein